MVKCLKTGVFYLVWSNVNPRSIFQLCGLGVWLGFMLSESKLAQYSIFGFLLSGKSHSHNDSSWPDSYICKCNWFDTSVLTKENFVPTHQILGNKSPEFKLEKLYSTMCFRFFIAMLLRSRWCRMPSLQEYSF